MGSLEHGDIGRNDDSSQREEVIRMRHRARIDMPGLGGIDVYGGFLEGIVFRRTINAKQTRYDKEVLRLKRQEEQGEPLDGIVLSKNEKRVK